MDGPRAAVGWRPHSCEAALSQMWAAGAPLRRGPTHPRPTSTSRAREPAFWEPLLIYLLAEVRGSRTPSWRHPAGKDCLLLWEQKATVCPAA